MFGTTTLMPRNSGSVTHYPVSGQAQGLDTLYAQPGQFANAMGNAFGGYGQGMGGVAQGYGGLGSGLGTAMSGQSQGLAGMGQAIAGNYGQFAQGNAQIAQALASERANAYNAMSMSEAARQSAAGNVANQALASYGSLGNSAMAAWAQNQSAYNQALQNMFAANQMSAGQLGQSRNQALSNLGSSVASLGGRLGAANVIANMDLGGGGGMGFEATGPQGLVASGSFGGTGGGLSGSGGRGPGPGLAGVTDQGFGALDALRRDINDNTFLNTLEQARREGMGQLDAQHYSSRSMPFDQLSRSFNDFQTMAGQGYSALRQGMDQFYGNLNDNRADFSPFTQALQSGFDTSSRDLRDMGGRMSDDYRAGLGEMRNLSSGLGRIGTQLTSGMSNVQKGIRDLFDNSLGNMALFQNPAQQQSAAQQRRTAYEENRKRQQELTRQFRNDRISRGLITPYA